MQNVKKEGKKKRNIENHDKPVTTILVLVPVGFCKNTLFISTRSTGKMPNINGD